MSLYYFSEQCDRQHGSVCSQLYYQVPLSFTSYVTPTLQKEFFLAEGQGELVEKIIYFGFLFTEIVKDFVFLQSGWFQKVCLELWEEKERRVVSGV